MTIIIPEGTFRGRKKEDVYKTNAVKRQDKDHKWFQKPRRTIRNSFMQYGFGGDSLDVIISL